MKITTIILSLLLCANAVYTQTTGRSKSGSFGPALPPAKLEISTEFIDPSGNGFLDASENALLKVSVTNSGGSAAKNVVVTLSVVPSVSGFRLSQSSLVFGDILPKAAVVKSADVSAAENIKTAAATIQMIATDDRGVKSESRSVTITTKEVIAAKDKTPPTIDLKQPVLLSARGVKVKFDDMNKTETASIAVSGVASDESGIAMVLINGHEAPLSSTKEGTSFTDDVLLTLGKNEIEIKAVDKFGNERMLKFEMTREAEMLLAKKHIPKNLFKGQRWGVIVGISDYKDPELPDLRYADKDAEAFYDFLTKPLEEGGGGVSKANVRYLVNDQATTSNVREALTDFLKSAIEEDIVYIYFAGHGAPDPDRPKVLYLLTHDSKLSKLGGTAIKMQEVQDILRDYVAAKTVLVFADACHSRGVSGSLATRALATPDLVNEFLSDLARSRASTCTFSASDVDQLSQEDKRWGGGHGVFTYYLIEALKGAADSDKDNIVRLGEVLLYVNDKVRRETKSQQSPMPSGSYDASLPLTVVP